MIFPNIEQYARYFRAKVKVLRESILLQTNRLNKMLL